MGINGKGEELLGKNGKRFLTKKNFSFLSVTSVSGRKLFKETHRVYDAQLFIKQLDGLLIDFN